MSHHEHAQQIYSMLLAAWAASGRPLPSTEEAASYAEMSVKYAKAFADKAKAMSDKELRP